MPAWIMECSNWVFWCIFSNNCRCVCGSCWPTSITIKVNHLVGVSRWDACTHKTWTCRMSHVCRHCDSIPALDVWGSLHNTVAGTQSCSLNTCTTFHLIILFVAKNFQKWSISAPRAFTICTCPPKTTTQNSLLDWMCIQLTCIGINYPSKLTPFSVYHKPLTSTCSSQSDQINQHGRNNIFLQFSFNTHTLSSWHWSTLSFPSHLIHINVSQIPNPGHFLQLFTPLTSHPDLTHTHQCGLTCFCRCRCGFQTPLWFSHTTVVFKHHCGFQTPLTAHTCWAMYRMRSQVWEMDAEHVELEAWTILNSRGWCGVVCFGWV